MINKRQKVSIENTRFIFTTNFSGDPSRDRFGSNKRRVNLVLTEDMAHHLMDMGVTVKQTRPNPEKTYDEPFLPTYFVPVNVNMESKWPPHVYWVTTTGKKLLCDIDMVGQLDYIRNVHADGHVYLQHPSYTVTVMTKTPDSDLTAAVSRLDQCRHDRSYIADNLYHDVFTMTV